MSDYTITYSESVKGFPSFYSYIPEYIIGMIARNNFYGNAFSSTLTSVFNVNPTESKRFKTLSLEADNPWGATFKTNLETGAINSAWYDLKEGTYYASIRANTSPVNFHMRSIDGIGQVTTVANPSGTTYTLLFTFLYLIIYFCSRRDCKYWRCHIQGLKSSARGGCYNGYICRQKDNNCQRNRRCARKWKLYFRSKKPSSGVSRRYRLLL